MVAPYPFHEIKGTAFVTLVRWARQCPRPAGAYDALLDGLSPEDRRAILGALPSDWFPEELHVRAMRALAENVARGNLAEYERFIAECTKIGMASFARLVLTMASPSFVVRRMPALRNVLRRGPGTLAVEQHDGVSELRYRGFPYFDEVVYRHYFRALLGALVEPALGARPDVQIVAYGHDWLDARIAIG